MTLEDLMEVKRKEAMKTEIIDKASKMRTARKHERKTNMDH